MKVPTKKELQEELGHTKELNATLMRALEVLAENLMESKTALEDARVELIERALIISRMRSVRNYKYLELAAAGLILLGVLTLGVVVL